ncbi:MAG TPA: hypothetical protein VFA11_07195 [Acidimicrobiales bacterium]|nr:hypothetical protein [Acidimicrobiales bacterium]
MDGAWARWEAVVGSPDSDPLEVIALAGTYHRYLAAIEERAVRVSRARGATWQEIADAAGTTRQSAWEKWKAVEQLTEGAPDRFGAELMNFRREASADALASLQERRQRRAK